ncbi:hypothetical protein ACFZB9_18075 [Kitasatospora sp. NPDC008050]|uniref:hypothetical protein n=1 Tax=Kitasatospora sp. NPDC008050 TaxID=3364021 RepID=UPI0036EEC5B3
MTVQAPLTSRAFGAAGTVGEFETHLTLTAMDAGSTARTDTGPGSHPALARWAQAHGLKYTHIVLARGQYPSQPMLSWTAAGTFQEQLDRAEALAAALRTDGFTPVRVKCEAAPWAPGVPDGDREAELLGPGYYFEHHLKVLLPPGDRAALVRAVAGHTAHVSWNARRTDPTGRSQQFVTQRCHGVGRRTAEYRLAALTEALVAAGHPPIAVEREFVVHDSNLAVDDGWMDDNGPIPEDPTP